MLVVINLLIKNIGKEETADITNICNARFVISSAIMGSLENLIISVKDTNIVKSVAKITQLERKVNVLGQYVLIIAKAVTPRKAPKIAFVKRTAVKYDAESFLIRLFSVETFL